MAKKKAKSATCVRGLYRKRDKFVFQPPMIDGHRPPSVFIDTTDLSEAILEAEKLRLEGTVRQTEEETRDLRTRYLRSKANSKKHKGPVTTETASASLERFVIRFPSLRSISPRGLEQWKEEMIQERKKATDDDGKEIETEDPALSISSVASYLRYAQSFCTWLAKERYLGRSPFVDTPGLIPRKLPTRRLDYQTKEDRDKLIANCPHLELQAVLFFGFHTGMRRQELLNIRPTWFLRDADGRPNAIHVQPEDGKDGTTVFTIKDDERKTIPLSDPLVEFILEHELDQRSPYVIAPEIRPGKYKYRWDWEKRLENYVKAQGVPRMTAHTMRHTFVTLLLSAPPQDRPSLLHLSRWTGDDVETLTRHYAHLLDDRNLINAAN